MKNTVIKGDLCFSRSMDELTIIENGYLAIENGVCVDVGVYDALPSRFAA